ncbi:DUF2269 domain-containing protein [Saccharothrix sp. AJ9571]|nr:DUF2269 domain-containing protein [Saccharothrix sp. AJ9571]
MTSVGWLGAVATVLVLAILGMVSSDLALVRASYVMMEPTAQFVLVPLAFAALLSGLVQSLGTKWGVLRHYWVLIKLLINVGAVAVLVMYTRTLSLLADIASAGENLAPLRTPTAVVHAALALLLLIGATALGMYKPRGTTPLGRGRQRASLAPTSQ